MPAYKKDINILPTKEEFGQVLAKVKSPRDRFILCMFYLTGCRPSELRECKKEDIIINEDGSLAITLTTKKLGKKEGFIYRKRTLDLVKGTPFLETIIVWVKANIPGAWLCNLTEVTLWRLVDSYSAHLWCPYTFRNNRLTRLARDNDADLSTLMSWKGTKDTRSIGAYIGAKRVGKKLKIE